MRLDEPHELGAARAVVDELCRTRAKELYYATLLLPQQKRQAARAVGVFATMIDDAVGVEAIAGACALGEAGARVERVRERIVEVYEGQVTFPAVGGRSADEHAILAFADAVRRYEVPREHFIELAEGRAIERTTARYATWPKLQDVFRRTAGAIAQVLVAVVGAQNSAAAGRMADLAVGVRVARMVAEVKKNLGYGRVYLPLEDLARFQYSEKDLIAGLVNERLTELAAFEAGRGRELLRRGMEGVPWLADSGARLVAGVVGAEAEQLLAVIEGSGGNVVSRPPTVGWAKKVTAAMKGLAVAGRAPETAL